jgi:serine/threonine-protein kinase
VLIEMLSGQFPFEGCTSYPQLAQAKRELEQRLPELIPAEVVESEMLMTLCQRLIAANPADRFPSAHAAELGEDGAAGFHRQLATVNLASEYNHDLRVWLDPLRSDSTP